MNEKAIIEGHIYTVNNTTETLNRDNMKPFKVKIMPGAFDKSIGVYGNVPLYFNHERQIAEADDMEIYEDSEGLFFRVSIDDIEVISKCFFNKVKGCSPSYKVIEECIRYGEIELKTTIEMLLLEISISDMETGFPGSAKVIYLPEELKMKVYQYHVDDLSRSMEGR